MSTAPWECRAERLLCARRVAARAGLRRTEAPFFLEFYPGERLEVGQSLAAQEPPPQEWGENRGGGERRRGVLL